MRSSILPRCELLLGGQTGQVPTDKRKNGSKHHILTDGQGTPFASKVASANRHDVTQTLALVDSVQPLAGKPGRPRFRPEILQGDRAYDSKALRLGLIKRGIIPKLAKRNTPNGSGLGVSHTLGGGANFKLDPPVQKTSYPL